MKNIYKLIVSIVVCELAGVVGSLFTSSSVSTWYLEIQKPALNPPSWIFGPVWITLYALMGVAVYLVWSSYAKATDGQAQKRVKIALWIFGIQLVLNTLWSILFFGSTSLTINGLNNIGLAFVDIVALWIVILWTIVVFYKIFKPAGYLLIPYILWVSFAMYLNYAIWVIN